MPLHEVGEGVLLPHVLRRSRWKGLVYLEEAGWTPPLLQGISGSVA